MKHILFLLAFLSGFVLNAMEEKRLQPKRKFEEINQSRTEAQQPALKKLHYDEIFLEDLGLPNEMWARILEHVYFDSTILDKADDIYEGITAVKKYILKYFKTISLVCKTFKPLNISQSQWSKIKKELRAFYIPHLNQKFLEQHQGQEGLYPKNDTWHENTTISNNIGGFLAAGIMHIDTLTDILQTNYSVAAHLKLITLLLFYGASPNLQNKSEETALWWATFRHYQTNRNNSEIINLLLQHGANANLQDNDGKTAFDFAKDNNFNEFPQLVGKHSKNTLTKICLQYILTNFPQFEGQLDTLPAELRDSIHNLKS